MTTFVETTDAPSTNATSYVIAPGDYFEGTMTAGVDLQDYVGVTLEAGVTYTFGMTSLGPLGEGLDDPLLALYAPGGAYIMGGADAGPGNFDTITYTAPTTDTYYLLAATAAITGTQGYALSAIEGDKPSYSTRMGAAALMRPDVMWAPSPGTPVTVTWGVRDTAPSYIGAVPFSQLTAAQADAFANTLDYVEAITNLDFQQVNPGGTTDQATMLFGAVTAPGASYGAYAYYPDDTSFAEPDGDSILNNSYVSTTSLPDGSYSGFVIVHELGHALGLAHPGDYNAGDGQTPTYDNLAQFIQDSHQYTVLSYWDESETTTSFGSFPDTYLLMDIYALQWYYGTDVTYNDGNTRYGFNATVGGPFDFSTNLDPFLSIWDGGGDDTLDVSGFADDQLVDLREGQFSDIAGLKGNVSIAYGAVIENAVGGTGNDRLRGETGTNMLDGGTGDDTLEGLGGADSLVGSAGLDIADYSVSPFALTAGLWDGNSRGGHAQGDTWTGIEGIIGTAFGDHITGDAQDNLLDGGNGGDILIGDFDFDRVALTQPTGVAEYLLATALPMPTGDMTLEFLFRSDEVFDNRMKALVSYSVPGDANELILLVSAIGELEIYYAGAVLLTGVNGTGLFDGALHRVSLRVDSDTDTVISILVDGEVVATETTGLSALETGGTLIFGQEQDSFGGTFDPNQDVVGEFADIRIFDTARTDGSIREDVFANEVKGPDAANLVGHWAVNAATQQIDALVGSTGLSLVGGSYLSGQAAGDDTLTGGAGQDLLFGRGGSDTADYSGSMAAVRADLRTQEVAGGDATGDVISSIESAIGSAYDDTLFGAATDSTLVGLDGDDTLVGDSAMDRLSYDDPTTGADRLAAASLDMPAGDTTFEFMIRHDGPPALEFLVSYSAASTTQSYFVYTTPTGFGFFYQEGNAGGFTGIAADMSLLFDGQPHRISVVVDTGPTATQSTLYVDGNVIGTVNHVPFTFADGGTLMMGLRQSGAGNVIEPEYASNGEFGDIRVFGTARSAADVARDAQSSVVTGSDAAQLAHHWQVDADGGLIATVAGSTDMSLTGNGTFVEDTGFSDDLLEGGAGADLLEGGGGNDTASYADSASGVVISLFNTLNVGGDADGDVLRGIENLVGSAYDDGLLGDDGDNELISGTGDDYVSGLAGNDTLSGGVGADSIYGGSGEDTATYATSSAGVTVDLGAGTSSGGDAAGDEIYGIEHLVGSDHDDDLRGNDQGNNLDSGAGNDTVDGGAGNDTVNSGAGADTITGDGGNDSVLAGTGQDSVLGGDGNDTLWGNGSNDTVIGNAGNDFLHGGDQNDLVQGGDGDDTVGGGNGADTVEGGAGNDEVNGGASADLLRGNDGNDTLLANTGEDTLFGGTGDDDVNGGDQNDTVYGNQGSDTVNGGFGNDAVYGGDDNDTVFGGFGNDGLFGGSGDDLQAAGAGTDTLYGNTGNDTLFGGDDNDLLYGNAGEDLLGGGNGADTLIGGEDSDRLIGDGGADVFRFLAVADTAVGAGDVIADFVQGTDVIDLAAIDALVSTGADDAFTFLGTAAHTGAGATLRYSNVAGNTYIYGDVDADAAGDFVIVLEGTYTLAASDFVL